MDISTLAIILNLICGMQVVALFGQHRLDRTHSGPDWWTLGSALLALGFAFHALQNIPPLRLIAVVIHDVLFCTSQALFYVGVLRFFNQKEPRGWLLAIGMLSGSLLIYFTCVNNDLWYRELIVSCVVAALSFFIAKALWVHKSSSVRESAHFLAAVFLCNGLFFALYALIPGGITVDSTVASHLTQVFSHLETLISSTFWTFGFIIMVNQRLNAENREAKEHFELIFNTSPDAVLITRMTDGCCVGINDAFTTLTGFGRSEVIGKSPLELTIWNSTGEHHDIAAEVGERNLCKNREVVFQQKNGSRLIGILSEKIITLHGTSHVLSVTRDITERKQAEQALEESNRKLEALSITDGLTGIANRRHFDEMLIQEHARHARSGAELSVVLLDIDHFKAFNDNYGHVKGDECLRQIAQVIDECANRPADLAARYGGEEFVCILPETDSNGAVIIAEKIRRNIRKRAIPHKGSTVADFVTASLGVVTVHCFPDDVVVDILTQVDELLYKAKSAGRDRVEFVAERDLTGNVFQLIWKDSFCCGNELLDSQHQALFHGANKLLHAALSNPPSPDISTIIATLLDDVSEHFHDEEQILDAAGFPDLAQHAGEHVKLLTKGFELLQLFNDSKLTVGDTFQFLVYDVVMLHILGADREYFPILNKDD